MQYLSRAISVTVNQKIIGCSEQPPFNSLAEVGSLFFRQFSIKKRGFRSIAFRNAFEGYTNLLTFGAKFLPKPTIREGDKVLVVALANIDFLLDTGKVTHDDSPKVIFDTIISQVFRRTIEIVAKLMGALTAQAKHSSGYMRVPLKVFNTLQSRIFFVVPLVNALEVTAINYKGRPRSRIKARGKVIKPQINRQIVSFGQFCGLHLLFVNIFNIKFFTAKDWHNPHLLQLGNLNVLGQDEDQLFDFRLIGVTEGFREANMNVSISNTSRPTLDREHSQRFFLFVVWQLDLGRILTFALQPEQAKKGLHITVNDLQNLLTAISQKQAVILVCFARVVILGVRQILSVIKVELSNRVQPHIIQASRVITHLCQQIKFVISQSKPIFLSKYHYFHKDIIYET